MNFTLKKSCQIGILLVLYKRKKGVLLDFSDEKEHNRFVRNADADAQGQTTKKKNEKKWGEKKAF